MKLLVTQIKELPQTLASMHLVISFTFFPANHLTDRVLTENSVKFHAALTCIFDSFNSDINFHGKHPLN